MPDFLYCGTDAQVSADNTRQFLAGGFCAIWCPPPSNGCQWPSRAPVGGERLWLVWRSAGAQPLLLGGGRIAGAPRQLWSTSILWTERDRPGLRAAARSLGYHVVPAMAVLRIEDPLMARKQPVLTPNVPAGLSQISPAQAAVLSGELPIT
jgi:hypothetical protein